MIFPNFIFVIFCDYFVIYQNTSHLKIKKLQYVDIFFQEKSASISSNNLSWSLKYPYISLLLFSIKNDAIIDRRKSLIKF